ncbi:hypothetical protein [Olivibacter sitiensis]|uniref:hypothetical protein n=1 Tax=Olivibacter sitiensis TaxID=376470 RepID=UPI0012FC5E10|nr:hypothetical protein [Olivibacter sitiensis]
MKNDFTYQIPKDDNEYIDHLTHEFLWPLRLFGYEKLKESLWSLTKVVTAQDPEHDYKTKDFTKVIETMKDLINGAWVFKDRMRRERFTPPLLNIEWVENPFRQKVKHQDPDYDKRNRPGIASKGDLKQLNKYELRNFNIALDDFFSKISVVEWCLLLDKWHEYANKWDSIASSGWDDQPLDTYENFLKLIEVAYYVQEAYYCGFTKDGMPHNEHLFEDDYTIIHLDAGNTGKYNPLEHINWIMHRYNATSLKQEIDEWFDCGIEKDSLWNKGEPGKLVRIYEDVATLLEGGWLLTQGDEVPSFWLDPDTYDHFEEPKLEEGNGLKEHHLTNKQFSNPHWALSKIYRRTGVGLARQELLYMLHWALQKEFKAYNQFDELRQELFKIIELIYLINIEVCSRRTKRIKEQTEPN